MTPTSSQALIAAALRRTALWPLLLVAVGATAQESVVIYRCTDAGGAVTLQNDRPCPKGSRQQRRVLEVPPAPAMHLAPPAPLDPVAASAVSPLEAEVAPAPAPAPIADKPVRIPPPPLYACEGDDGSRYLSDTEQPPPRCLPLAITGLDGTDGTAAGSACQMVEDRCRRVPDEALCAQWQQRLQEAQSQLNFGTAEQRDAAQAVTERAQGIVRDSACSE